jgi:hypothetical protein
MSVKNGQRRDVTSKLPIREVNFPASLIVCYWRCTVSPSDNKVTLIRFEDFTAVTMKNAIFWDVAP